MLIRRREHYPWFCYCYYLLLFQPCSFLSDPETPPAFHMYIWLNVKTYQIQSPEKQQRRRQQQQGKPSLLNNKTGYIGPANILSKKKCLNEQHTWSTIPYNSPISIHLIEKTLSGEKHKPLTMRSKGVLGRCISSFAYSKYKPVLLWLMLIAASCTWQWKPYKPTWKGPNWPTRVNFERYTVRNLPKFASVPELKQILLENYSVELSPATNHSFTVGYLSDGRTKCDIKTDKQCKWTAFKMEISKLFECFPVYHWVVSFMVCGLHPTTFFQSGIYILHSNLKQWTSLRGLGDKYKNLYGFIPSLKMMDSV